MPKPAAVPPKQCVHCEKQYLFVSGRGRSFERSKYCSRGCGRKAVEAKNRKNYQPIQHEARRLRRLDLEYRKKELARDRATTVIRRLENPELYRARDRASKLKTHFRMTMSDYATMMLAQGGRCKICRTTKPGYKSGGGSFAVDHCHKTGRVRGLLCNTCNSGIGKLHDDPNLLRVAIVYLEGMPSTDGIGEGLLF